MKDIVVSVASSEVSLVDGAASMTVSVQNQTSTPERIVLSTVVAPATGGPAITIERALREIQPGTMEQYLVTFARGDAVPGRYDLKFIASPSEEATEEYAERAGRLSVVVPAPKEEPKPKFRWWPIAAAAVAILLVIGAVTFLLTRPDTVALPNVVNQPQAEAVSTLTSLGLSTGISFKPGIKPLGVVESQEPAAGTRVKEGSQVNMVVRTSTELPELKAMTAKEALAQLQALGFTTMATAKAESTAAAGTVLAQDPKPGTPLALDDRITLTIATPVLVTVPPVIGREFQLAGAILQSFGLGSSRGACITGRCLVVDQRPAAGTRVPAGTSILLILQPLIG